MGSFGSGHYFNQDRGTCEPLRRPKKSCDISPSLLSPELPLRSLYHAVLYVPQSEVSRTQTPIGSVLWLPSPRAESRPLRPWAWQVRAPPPQASSPAPPVAFPERQQEGGKCGERWRPQGKPLGPTGSLYAGRRAGWFLRPEPWNKAAPVDARSRRSEETSLWRGAGVPGRRAERPPRGLRAGAGPWASWPPGGIGLSSVPGEWGSRESGCL